MIQKYTFLFLNRLFFIKLKKYIDNSIKNHTFVDEMGLVFYRKFQKILKKNLKKTGILFDAFQVSE